jgi:hypothetical protein
MPYPYSLGSKRFSQRAPGAPHDPKRPNPAAPLANGQHEQFAQSCALGMAPSAAYRAAYPASSKRSAESAAPRLTALVRIRARISWLKSIAARDTAFTLERLIAAAEQARRHAHEAGQLTAAVLAVKELGILTGLRVEQREVRTARLEDMSTSELLAIAASGRQTDRQTALAVDVEKPMITDTSRVSSAEGPSAQPEAEAEAEAPAEKDPTPRGMDRPPRPEGRPGSPLSRTDCAGERE